MTSRRPRCSVLIATCIATLIAGAAHASPLAPAPGPRTGHVTAPTAPDAKQRMFRTLIVDVADVPASLQHRKRSISVLDTRGAMTFAAEHIVGARRITWEETSRSGLREGRLKSTTALAELFAEHGVSNDRPVLVCGAGRDGWGEEGRIAWVLLYLGHKDVAVLDGGCAAWGKAGRRTALGPVFGGAAGNFRPEVQRGWRIERPALKSAVDGSTPPTVLDVRTRAEYDGATPYFSARGGHIKGAEHLPLTVLYDADGRVLKPAALRKQLRARGVKDDHPVALYCTGGVRSAMAALILRQAGYAAVNYDGSWWDWSADASAPIAQD